jgi:hypothetical protein
MIRYNLCGLTVDSDQPLPELIEASSSKESADLRLRRESEIPGTGRDLRPAASWTLPSGGRPFFVSTKTENGYFLRFTELVDFYIDQFGTEVVYSPWPGAPADSVRHVFMDSVVALVLSLRGHAVLHASAVATPFGACAFAAQTGTGKSTLAASFQAAGYATLTDDCLLLEMDGGRHFGRPSYPGVRLRDDSLSLLGGQRDATLSVAHYNTKRRYRSGPFADGRQELGTIYCLERPQDGAQEISTPQITTFSARDGLLAVLRYLFCLDPYDPALLVRQFKMLELLVTDVPVRRLIVPNDFRALPSIHAAVLSDLERNGQARTSSSNAANGVAR